jgi:hypothetical protein
MLLSSPYVLLSTHRSHLSRRTISFGCETAAPSMSGSWPDSRRVGMRSARRRASRALDRSCLDLGLSLRLLLGLPFERAGRPMGFASSPASVMAPFMSVSQVILRAVLGNIVRMLSVDLFAITECIDNGRKIDV